MDIIIPSDLWEDDAVGVISSWLYDDGDTVSKGEVIVEIMVEKVVYELEAQASGKLVQLVDAEAEVAEGAIIGRIE